jgi:hypothetical protein
MVLHAATRFLSTSANISFDGAYTGSPPYTCMDVENAFNTSLSSEARVYDVVKYLPPIVPNDLHKKIAIQ